MNLKLLAAAFLTVFVAELGDKTQLATLALATEPGSKWSVFAGASLALICTSFLAIMLAGWLSQWFQPYLIKRISAVLFLVLGALMLKDSFS